MGVHCTKRIEKAVLSIFMRKADMQKLLQARTILDQQ